MSFLCRSKTGKQHYRAQGMQYHAAAENEKRVLTKAWSRGQWMESWTNVLSVTCESQKKKTVECGRRQQWKARCDGETLTRLGKHLPMGEQNHHRRYSFSGVFMELSTYLPKYILLSPFFPVRDNSAISEGEKVKVSKELQCEAGIQHAQVPRTYSAAWKLSTQDSALRMAHWTDIHKESKL